MLRVLDHYPFVGERYGEYRETGGGVWVDTACPLKCHRTATVRWWVWGEANALCLKCWAGCPKLEILRAGGLAWKDCFPAATDWKNFRPRQEVVARYSYTDEAGDTLYQTLRLEPGHRGRDKEFRQRRKVGEKWVYELGDVRRVLYHLPDILSYPDKPVLVVAGEKDADGLRELGVVATTNVCGERSEWLDSYSLALAGRDVVVVEDRDSAGRRHANEVVGSLIAHSAASVRRCVLPAKDATAFLNGLRTKGISDRAALRRHLSLALTDVPAWRPDGPAPARAGEPCGATA